MANRPAPITKKFLLSSALGGASSVEPTTTPKIRFHGRGKDDPKTFRWFPLLDFFGVAPARPASELMPRRPRLSSRFRFAGRWRGPDESVPAHAMTSLPPDSPGGMVPQSPKCGNGDAWMCFPVAAPRTTNRCNFYGRGRRLFAATPNREERMTETFAAEANLARLSRTIEFQAASATQSVP
jgi:hypothetical protein